MIEGQARRAGCLRGRGDGWIDRWIGGGHRFAHASFLGVLLKEAKAAAKLCRAGHGRPIE